MMLMRIVKAGGVALTGVALAGTLAWSGMNNTSSAYASTQANAQVSQALFQQGGSPGEPGLPGLHRKAREQAPEALAVTVLVRSTAEVTGLTGEQVLDQLRAGQSLAQIAEANGSSGDIVIETATTKIRERLDTAVERGRMTQAQADTLLDEFTSRADEVVDDTELGSKLEARLEEMRDQTVRGVMVKRTAEATGLEVREVVQRLAAGETLEAIAQSAGLSSADVVEGAVTDFRTAAEAAMIEPIELER
ncbi:hypothetical protein [Candidatus Chloroploca sp. Khr17]|uniref:hypothetical protein n=1 Tax=Candidatus Chloroploca sp. Khr17 TaxID=2496869 RepID=UPI00101CBEAE|nr:hypothetical protein [Candidatus Chloroploca sp. Khr17]